MQNSSQPFFRVKNYYKLDQTSLDKSIEQIRDWLFNFPRHEQVNRVTFALEVALCAKDLKKDKFINELLDFLID